MPNDEPIGRTELPRHAARHAFCEGLQIQIAVVDGRAALCRGVIEPDAEQGDTPPASAPSLNAVKRARSASTTHPP